MREPCLTCKREPVRKLLAHMRRCDACTFMFLTPEERARQQASFHLLSESGVDQAHLATLKQKYPKEYHGKRALYAKYAAEVVAHYGTDVRVLDVGASGGFFLREIEKLGAAREHLRTLEVDPTYVALAQDYFSYEGDLGNIETYKAGMAYNVVALFDVLEHVDAFWLALENIRNMLSDGGRLILKLPNGNWAYGKYLLAKLFGRTGDIPKLLYLEPGGHLNYWNRRSIVYLEHAGFTLESFTYVRPTREQFKRSYPARAFWYHLNRLCHVDLYPEFIAVLQKRSSK